MARSVWVNSLKIFSVDFIGKILFWPLWWYSLGLRQLISSLAGNILEEERRIGVFLWWRNLFTPMYGQYDWQGRLISFFMRLVIGIGRTLLLVLWLALTLVVLVLWVFGPPVAGYFLWRNSLLFFDVSWQFPWRR